MTVTIRRYQAGDAPDMLRVMKTAIAAIGPRHYRDDQIAAWLKLAGGPFDMRRRAESGRTIWLAELDSQVEAFIDLESDGHIDLFYAAPKAAGGAATRQLYRYLEDYARHRGMPRLFTEASEAAMRFFRTQGFAIIERRDLMLDGTAIHNYAMEERLS